MKGDKERKAGGLSAVGGDEAIFQMSDGGRHDLRLEPRFQSPRRAFVIFL